MRPRQNGRHLADDIFTCLFLNENMWISINISLNVVAKGWINYIPVLVQIVAWCQPGASHYLNQWWLVYWCIYASLGVNEFNILPTLHYMDQECLFSSVSYRKRFPLCGLQYIWVRYEHDFMGLGCHCKSHHHSSHTVRFRQLNHTELSWWRHQMEIFSTLLALCAGKSPVTGEFRTQRPVTRSFEVSLICAWINGLVNNRETGDLRPHRAHYDVILIMYLHLDKHIEHQGISSIQKWLNSCHFRKMSSLAAR